MTTLTTNLFRGHGEGSWELDIVEGTWPDDVGGDVFMVGPDKRRPGGHWFGEWGLLHRIDLDASAGRLRVDARRISTPVERLSRRFPRLFRRVRFAEVSPFGLSNLGNTNVQGIDGRLFVGYDAGRPIEVDPVTLEAITPIGSNAEWEQLLPGAIEPMCPVAAHPANAWDERAMYFVNYFPVPGLPTSIARWGLSGPLERWPLDGMGDFDSIHDIKSTRNHLVFCDLPFKLEFDPIRRGVPRSRANEQRTRLWIVAKEQLRRTAPGRPVQVTELPMPTGHLIVDEDDAGGVLRVHAEHIPLADLMITFAGGEVTHSGATVHPDHEGMVCLGVQPGCIGTYEIDAHDGSLLGQDQIWDDRFWGGVLSTHDNSTPAARASVGEVWFAGLGYHPDLVSEEWWNLYAGMGSGLVEAAELPREPRPGALCHFDVASRKVVGLHEYPPGEFPSPPTFVPSTQAASAGDGYVLVLVHADAGKQFHIFDARDIERGPIARAAAPGFNPPLLLHSWWMERRRGPRPSDYRVTRRSDLAGAAGGLLGLVGKLVRMVRATVAGSGR
jgi:all-trans-8'-apo-beta-carotenal 15,15'-oxygenase